MTKKEPARMSEKSSDEIRSFLTRPVVIDWLQYGEFVDTLGERDMPQITLSLLAEYKEAIARRDAEMEGVKREFRKLQDFVQKHTGMGFTRYSSIMQENHELQARCEIYEKALEKPSLQAKSKGY